MRNTLRMQLTHKFLELFILSYYNLTEQVNLIFFACKKQEKEKNRSLVSLTIIHFSFPLGLKRTSMVINLKPYM